MYYSFLYNIYVFSYKILGERDVPVLNTVIVSSLIIFANVIVIDYFLPFDSFVFNSGKFIYFLILILICFFHFFLIRRKKEYFIIREESLGIGYYIVLVYMLISVVSAILVMNAYRDLILGAG